MYNRGSIRKTPKPASGKKSPGVSTTKERSHPSPVAKKSPNKSEYSVTQKKEERKNESRYEYVLGPDNKWMKVDKVKDKIGKGKGSKHNKIPSPASKVAKQNPSPPKGKKEEIPEAAGDNKVETLIKKLHDTKKETVATTLEELEKEMTSKYLPDSLSAWTLTIGSALSGIVENKDTKMAPMAARASALMCVQLGGLNNTDLDRMYTEYMRPVLLETLVDVSAASSLRALCAEAVGFFEFMAITDSKMTKETMDELLLLALNQSHGKSNDISPGAATVCSAALRSWSLILTGVSSVSTTDHLITRFSQLQNLLESSSAELRVASGKAMALLWELAKERGSSLTTTVELCDKFRNLWQDTNVDAKYDQQKTFRDVLKTFEDNDQDKGGTAFRFERKINTEVLYIESWVKKIQYDAFCRILNKGMDNHLQNNELLRSTFNLSSPLLYPKSEKPNSNEKRLHNGIVTQVRRN